MSGHISPGLLHEINHKYFNIWEPEPDYWEPDPRSGPKFGTWSDAINHVFSSERPHFPDRNPTFTRNPHKINQLVHSLFRRIVPGCSWSAWTLLHYANSSHVMLVRHGDVPLKLLHLAQVTLVFMLSSATALLVPANSTSQSLSFASLSKPIYAPYYVYFGNAKTRSLVDAFETLDMRAVTVGFLSAPTGQVNPLLLLHFIC